MQCIVQGAEVCLDPGILIPANNNAGPVDISEEDMGVWIRGSQEVVLDREIEERISRPGSDHELGHIVANPVDRDESATLSRIRVG